MRGEEGEIKMGCGGWWDGGSLEGRGIERDEGGTERDGGGGGGGQCVVSLQQQLAFMSVRFIKR